MGTCGSTSNKDVKEPKKSKDKKDQDSKEDKKTKNVTLKKELPNKYLVISGPSGVGKGTIIKEIFAAYTDHTKFSVSYTTRGPRPGEENGKDYNFISDEEFVAEIEKGNF